MSKDSAKKIPARIKGYVLENWGAPFVLGFTVLLVAAVALLILGLPEVAEAAGNFAYFSLVLGAVLQLVCFLRTSDVKNERQEIE
jgi:hypothetical protein